VVKSALEKAREAPGSTKARILAAAEEVFAARGFEGASTREIAARASVNISSLHYHWESKERLYLAVFRNVYDAIADLLQNTLAPLLAGHEDPDAVVDIVVRELFDFFAGNPNVPRLLMRRVVEDEDVEGEIEREVLEPALRRFSAWLGRFGRRRFSDTEARLFMLSVQTVLLVFVLDSRSYQALLGGSVRTPPLHDEVREHVVRLVRQLLG
jgi:TetR/AcrR family transcriptional regulator